MQLCVCASSCKNQLTTAPLAQTIWIDNGFSPCFVDTVSSATAFFFTFFGRCSPECCTFVLKAARPHRIASGCGHGDLTNLLCAFHLFAVGGTYAFTVKAVQEDRRTPTQKIAQGVQTLLFVLAAFISISRLISVSAVEVRTSRPFFFNAMLIDSSNSSNKSLKSTLSLEPCILARTLRRHYS